MPKQSGSIDLTAEKEASQVATTYITRVTDAGIRVHAEDNPTTDYVSIDATGMEVVQGGNSVAKFGASARIGLEDESHIELEFNSLRLVDGDDNAYLDVSDLRGRDGTFTRTDTYSTDFTDSISRYDLAIPATEVTSVKFGESGSEEDVDPSGYSVRRSSTDPYSGYITALVFSPPLSMIESYDPEELYPSTEVSLIVTYTSDIPARTFTFGDRTGSYGPYSSALGQNNTASGNTSHARGYGCDATGSYSHADGYEAKASGHSAHSFGRDVRATGDQAFAEGLGTVADGGYSHAQNYGTKALSSAQTVIGTFNSGDHYIDDNTITDTFVGDGSTLTFVTSKVSAYLVSLTVDGGSAPFRFDDDQRTFHFYTAPASGSSIVVTYYTTTHPSKLPGYGTYALIVGNGTDDSHRSNAFTVDWDGNVTADGSVSAGDDLVAGGAVRARSVSTGSVTATGGISASGNISSSGNVTASGYIRDTDITAEWSTLGSITATTRSCRRSSNVVTVTGVAIDLGGALSASASVDVGTVPADYRPKVNTYAQAFYSSGDLGSSYFRLDANGKLTFRAAKAVGAAVTAAFTMTFVV